MLAFPTDLPKPLNGSLGEKSKAAWVQDGAAVGRPRRRRVSSRLLRSWSFNIRCDLSQREVLLAFHDNDCFLGVGNFVWTHPSTEQLVQVQFAQRPEPTHTELHNYIMSVSLEEL